MPVVFTALPTAEVRALRTGGRDAYGQVPEVSVSYGPGNPCRHCLRFVPEGRPMLILAHRPFPAPQPYAETGPIFLCADDCARHAGGWPAILDGTPDYLVTRNFFADLRGCLATRGVAVLNTFADLDQPLGYAHFLTTLRSEFPYVTIYREPEPGARHMKSYVVASVAPLSAAPVQLRDVPRRYAARAATLLQNSRPLDPSITQGGHVITDARSAGAADIARTQMGYRRHVARDLPPAFLVN